VVIVTGTGADTEVGHISGLLKSTPTLKTPLSAQLDTLTLWIAGAAGDGEKELHAADLTGPLAIVMGSEGKGLRRLTRECCDFTLRLPMRGAVSSLNVSVAAGITLYEALRQRSAKVAETEPVR